MKDFLEGLKDIDYKVRLEAVRQLKLQGGKESIFLLIEALGDENEVVALEAIDTLKKMGEEVLPYMIEALRHTSWVVRRNAARVLVGLGNSFLEILLDLAKSNDDDIQFWIFEVISQFGSQSIPTLIDIMECGDIPKQICAISALGRTGVVEAVSPLIKCLSHEQWNIRKNAATALIKLGHLSVDELQNTICCGQSDIEFWAIQILGEVGGDKSRKILIKKIMEEHCSFEQKQVLIQALKNFDAEDVVLALIQMLGDQNWFVRKQAADALWELGDISEPYLGKALRSKNVDIRYWAIKVLGDLQADSWVDAFTEILKKDHAWSVRAVAAQALGEIGDETVSLDLVDALRDSSEYVKKNAMIALSRIGEIREAQSNFSEDWVQEYTREVFADLKSRRVKGIASRLKSMIADVPDFPEKGVIFRDITPLLQSPSGLNEVVKIFFSLAKEQNYDLIAGIESRGFIFGSALAASLKTGFVPIRKKGKLPGETICVEYDLEYGKAAIEVKKDSLKGKEVIVIDDVLATGGTAKAAAELIEKAGGRVSMFLFLIELDFLEGRTKLSDYKIETILHY